MEVRLIKLDPIAEQGTVDIKVTPQGKSEILLSIQGHGDTSYVSGYRPDADVVLPAEKAEELVEALNEAMTK